MKDLISFELAKKAKEAGYQLTRNYFGFIDKFYEPKTQSVRSFGLHGRTPIKDLIYIPNRHELAEWLREKRFFNITAVPISNNKYTFIAHYIHMQYDINDLRSNIKANIYTNQRYYSYNEAFDAGLEEILNQII
jgi:hypothetical protein